MSAIAEQALMTRLVADTDVSAIVGNRVYPHTAPQNATMPYIVYFRVSGVHEHHMRGSSGLYDARVQLSMFSTDFEQLLNLSDAVRLALDGYRGDVTVGTDMVRIHKCFMAANEDLPFTNPADAGQVGIYGRYQDYQVACDETTPAFSG